VISHAHADRLGAVVRAILDLRLFAVAVTLVYLAAVADRPVALVVALMVSLLCSAIPLLAWSRIAASVLRHPTWLAVDLVLSVAVLSLAGPESPFFLATLATAALAGIIYGVTGASVFTALLLAGWAAVIHLRPEGADELSAFASAVTLPALYPICAAAGAAVRRLLDKQAITEQLLLTAEHANTIAAERARMAREMHDSVGKSLHGIALSATALALGAARNPEGAGDAAGQLATAAKVAAVEARELIGDLRADDLRAELHEALAAVARRWGETTGVAIELELGPVQADGDMRYELLAIANEALRNVARHAHANAVLVVLEQTDGHVRLEVADDGRGLPADHDPQRLAGEGHFGLLGMRERAERLGGRLDVTPRDAGGTALVAVLPASQAATVAQQPQSGRRLRLRRLRLRRYRPSAGLDEAV
jgi:signal transduction histidine kinase